MKRVIIFVNIIYILQQINQEDCIDCITDEEIK